jgi:predicted nucleic acid-binding protein
MLYDTNILIDYLNGKTEAKAELAGIADRAISIITWIEVMVGVPVEAELKVRRFLATFEQIAVTKEVAEEAVKIRKETRLKLPDAMILATAYVSRRELVTRNTRDFHAGQHGIRIPYQL